MAGRTAAVIQFNHMPRLKGELRANASKVVRKTALDVLARAQSIVAVDTGYLKNSLSPGGPDNIFEMRPGDLEAVVGTAVSYSIFVELGTHRMASRPYLIPSAEAMRPVFLAAMQHLLKAA